MAVKVTVFRMAIIVTCAATQCMHHFKHSSGEGTEQREVGNIQTKTNIGMSASLWGLMPNPRPFPTAFSCSVVTWVVMFTDGK